MPFSLLNILHALPVFALILFRLTGLMLTAPIFGSPVIPVRIRAALMFTLAAMIFPVVSRNAPPNLTLVSVAVSGVTELMVGATIGLALGLVLMVGQITGHLVGQQSGLALSQVFDPTQGDQSTIVGQIYTIVLTLLFLSVGGHRETIAALLDTFEVVPLTSFAFDESILALLIDVLTVSFMVAVRVAGPVLIALFLMGTALGFLSRTMPQLNILTVGFTMRVMVGIGTAGLAISASKELLLESIWRVFSMIKEGFGLPTV